MKSKNPISNLYLSLFISLCVLGAKSYAAEPLEGNQVAGQDRIMIAYVWGQSNIGDNSITPGLLNLLYRNFPQYKMTPIGGSANYLHKDFPDCEVVGDVFAGSAYREALAKARKDFGGKLPPLNDGNVDYVFDTFAQNVVDSMRRDNPEFMKTLAETKLVIYNSGMILVYGKGTLAGTDFWGYSVRRSLPLLVAWKLGIPYGIYAHSFDSFGKSDKSPGRAYFRKLLEDAQFVFCRDGNSVQYIKGLGIKAPNLMFVPDSTVSFTGRDDVWAEAFMAKHDLKSKGFMVVGVRTCRGRSVISKAVSQQRTRAHCRKLCEIIEHWVRKTGMKVVVTVEVKEQLPNAKELVYDPLPADINRQCVMMDEFWTTEQAVSLFDHTRIVVTMELHVFLNAVPHGTPCVVPVFKEHNRKIWMLHDFKLGEYLFDIDTASTQDIEQGIYKIHDNYERESERIQKDVIPHLRAVEEKAMDVIAESLGLPAKPGSKTQSAPQIRLDQSGPDS